MIQNKKDADMTSSRPQGRPSGKESTKTVIIQTAQKVFAENGYNGSGLRAIAQQAGVDPSTVLYFFKTKLGLFQEVAQRASKALLPVFAALAAEKPGKDIARIYLSIWESEEYGASLKALVKTTLGSNQARSVLQEILTDRLSSSSGPENQLAIELCMAHLLGIAIARYLTELPIISTMSLEESIQEAGSILDAIRHLA
ncbi:MAG: TetR family transcriptional regulator [Rothia sp. (in: high G+C Gram-positive bacteria)]|nr:TetR family transcriptional regulator [Rothia sp. (in: high G+C Gram-positive bacteria)]